MIIKKKQIVNLKSGGLAMKLKLLLAALASIIVWALTFSGAATAQTQNCSGLGPSLTISPTHAPPGGSFTISEYGSANPSSESPPYYYWDQDGTNANLLGAGSWPSTPQQNYTSIANLTVPADATVGQHHIFLNQSWLNTESPAPPPTCASFTVDPPSVQQSAYSNAAPATTLPSTGFFLLIPAAGLGAGGLGGAMLRRRRRG